VGILFISHSSQDNDSAIKVRNWLKDHGWSQVFLDLDPHQGLAPGHRWQQELKKAGEQCSGVLILVSPNWIASRWCQTEFLIADQLGKRIFPLYIAPTPFGDLPLELRAKFQIGDISTTEKEADGFERLAIGLKRAGLDPSSFEWPPRNDPHRPIYRGLQSLDEQDAAIFFGRDAFITDGLDALRRMRDSTAKRVMVILGASGAGKSSFLKAGLIARLKRDEENFLVLPVVRPERAALSGVRGLAASLSCDAARLTGPKEVADAIARKQAAIVERFQRIADGAREIYTARPPSVVIPIDQAEELFAAENAESARVLEILAGALRADCDAIIVATIRSDSFERLQSEEKLADIPLLPFSLPPLPHGAFKEVIEGPARLAVPPLTIEPALSDRLLKDLAADDALPLLAFTLERLANRHSGGGTLTLSEYAEELGGLQGAIAGAVEAAFAQARQDPSLPDERVELEKLARAAFIPALVQLDDVDAEPKRRVERLSGLPESTLPLVHHLIDQRLLVSDRSTIDGYEVDTVEVAHEAILRRWRTLRGWIAEERDALRALDAARVAAAEWHAHATSEDSGKSHSWLAHRGGRLEEAESLIARPGFAAALGSTGLEYVAACRTNENAERARELQGLARTKRLQRNVGILIAIAGAIVLLAALGIVMTLARMDASASDTLIVQARKELDAGQFDSGARYALAGLARATSTFTSDNSTQVEVELRGAGTASSAFAVLRGHSDQVLSAAFSPDGRRIVTASRDRTARIWNASTGREIAILRGHEGHIESAKFSPDGTHVVTASDDGTARIWDTGTGHEIVTLRGHDDSVVGAAFSPDGTRIVTASWDKTARIWNAITGHEIAILRGHEAQVESAAFSPDGGHVVTASDDRTARIWDAKTGRELVALRGHESVVEGASFSPDGKRVATASDDKTARVWDAATARELYELRGHDNDVVSIEFSHSGTRIVTGSRDKTARIWDAATAREIAVLRGHDDLVNGAAFSPDGRFVVTASDDKTARVWDMARLAMVLRGHEGPVNGVAFSPDGTRIATASTDKTVRIWDAIAVREVAVLQGHEDIVESIGFSPDGTRIVSASDDKTARIWDVVTGRQLMVLRGHRDRVFSAEFSADGKRIVTASTDGTARVWDANTARVSIVLHPQQGNLNSASFSRDGLQIVTSADDETAEIWDAVTGRRLVVLKGHEGAVTSAAFSPDGKRVVTAARDRTARLWDAGSGRELAILRGHEDVVLSAAFSPDGTRIVTASRDRTSRLWDAGTASEIAVLRGHNDSVNNAVFGADGTHVVTASDDNTARIWNVSTITPTARRELIQRTCSTTLANGLSEFSAEELRAAPVLDPGLDTDACHPPSLWSRMGRLFLEGLLR